MDTQKAPISRLNVTCDDAAGIVADRLCADRVLRHGGSTVVL
jgi:hypothetical protein